MAPPAPTRGPARAPRTGGLLGDRTASAAVQFALVLPVFLSLTLGIIDMGRLMWTQVTIAQAARKGARYAMVRGSTADEPATAEGIGTYVKGGLAGPDATAAAVSVSWAPDNAPGGSVSVQVSYPFAFVALGFLPLAPVSLGSTAKTIVSG